MLAILRKGPVYLNFTVDINYDYSKSSEDNYKAAQAPFVGKYKAERGMLDYNYHHRYSEERQLLHDQLIDLFLQTRVKDHRFVNVICESPLENWIVFTAGPMGAGKGHTMNWLDHEGLFPLDAFVNVNPDAIR
ncbi:hypothetical protein EON65_44530 [archaeon]|nr:MAG: hypothetical protein EON65_44530 [archaeon]